MAQKNKLYENLIAQGYPREDLEKAKGRVRAAKSRLMRTKGLARTEAELEALRLELQRDSKKKQSVELPTPPPGSGLTIRGSLTPREGQTPAHWSFTIYDVTVTKNGEEIGKKRRIRYDEIPTDITAQFPGGIEETLLLKRGMESAQAGIMDRLEQQKKWIEQNKKHKELMHGFLEQCKLKRAEADRKTKKGCEGTALRAIYEFFLNLEQHYFLPDVRTWPRFFEEFRDHLKQKPVSRRNSNNPTLSKNTQKNYIGVLNKYVAYVWRKGKFDGKPPKCGNYNKRELERRGIDALISKEEEKAFVNHYLKLGLPKVAAFMKIANHIAARPSELLGVSIFDIKFGALPDDPKSPSIRPMKMALESIAGDQGLTVFGYVVIRGQVDNNSRTPDGGLKYYPVKTGDEVSPEYYRYCPVVDEGVWDTLRELALEQEKLYEKSEYGPEMERYLLFDKLTLSQIQEYFRLFRDGAGKTWASKKHTPHCCRHTACTTWVALANNNLQAAQLILGHENPKETKRYSHLATLFALELEKKTAKEQGRKFFDQFRK